MYKRNLFILLQGVLLFAVSTRTNAQPQQQQQNEQYYQFSILYDHPDSFRYENYYYLRERDFWSFDQRTTEFNGFPGGIFKGVTGSLGRLTNPIGFGVRFSKSTSAYPGHPVRILDREYPSSNIFDTTAVSVIALGINPGNAGNYEYRLVSNNQVIVKDWTSFTEFRQVPQTGYQYAVLGELLRPDGYLLIEARNKQTLQIAGSILLNWSNHSRLSVERTRIYFKENNAIGTNGYLDADLLKEKYATGKDSATGILKNLKFPGNKEYLGLIFDLKGVQFTFSYQAKLERLIDGKLDTMEVNYYFNSTALRIAGDLITRPGKYRLLVGDSHYFSHRAYEKWILKIPFEISASSFLSRKWTVRQILPYALGCLVALSLIFYAYYRINRRQLKRMDKEKQMKQLQLRNLQDQLNPHFLFNALSAIQNLVDKKDMQLASRYLERFSLLTRTILTNSHHEMISLEDELQIQQAYLEMEQLRTPFTFDIRLDKAINIANTEIPVMLLQPFVENAVKHGVSSSQVNGQIQIAVDRDGETLIFMITDNGTGIHEKQPQTEAGGWGLKLVAKRIKLLNDMYAAPLISYGIYSDESGTRVELRLKNWLS